MDRRDLPSAAALAVAVFGVSWSGSLIAYAAAPALAIAFWRTAIATGALAPVAVVTRRAELAWLLRRRDGLVSLLAGVALAAHFAFWVPSAKLTTVAAATALASTQPVWQGLIARLQGRGLPAVAWIGIGLAVAGAVLTTGADLVVSTRALVGDLLALAGVVAAGRRGGGGGPVPGPVQKPPAHGVVPAAPGMAARYYVVESRLNAQPSTAT